MARFYPKLQLKPFNPIAVREMKTRMRGPRTFALLGVHLTILALLILVVYVRKGANTVYSYGGSFTAGNFGPTRNFETGQDIFISIFLYLIIMVSVVTPAICGGLISREMEEGTYDMLLVTPVRGRSLIYGKLLAALGYLMFVVLASAPLACVVFVFGGVEPADVLAGFAIVLLLMLVLGTLSLLFSALFRGTSVAIIVTYGVMAFLLLGLPIISGSIVAAINADTNRIPPNVRIDPRIDPAFDLPKRMLIFNPVAALGSVLAPNAPYRPGNNEELLYFPNSKLFWGNPTAYYATPTFTRPRTGTTATGGSSTGSGSTTPQFAVDPEQAYLLSKKPILYYNVTLWQGYALVTTGLGVFFLLLSFAVVKPRPRRLSLAGLGKLRLPKMRLPKRSKAQKSVKPSSGPADPLLLAELTAEPEETVLAATVASPIEQSPVATAPAETKLVEATPVPNPTDAIPPERKRQALG